MKPTSLTSLGVVAAVCVVAAYLVMYRFFGALGPRSWWDLLFPWLLTGMCASAAIWVRGVLKDESKVGQDRSQVQPIVLARWLVVGTASAWLGAVLTGLYAGAALWALPRMGELVAASEDAPVCVVGAISGILLAAAGIWLEKECQLPPDDENTAPPGGETLPPSVGWGT